MLILPAIDLLDGHPVRLRQGDFHQVTHFGDDAVGLARGFVEAGAPWLHVVDLDGARSGTWRNLPLIAQIAAAVSIPIQAGGGARRIDDVDAALRCGVARVVVATAAIESPAGFSEWTARFGAQLAVSLDLRDGAVALRGWTAESTVDLLTLAQRLQAAGVTRFVQTDVRRDGTLDGVDLTGLSTLLPLGLPVIVAGGIRNVRDIEAIRDAGAEGAIVGRALLDGTLDLRQALTIAASAINSPRATPRATAS
jgi:phosphoribosylformimino-5-aminoimidazole carboxamide ribotide isomerase